jgi:CubicO group peptidase (beta-lactamase class C family)
MKKIWMVNLLLLTLLVSCGSEAESEKKEETVKETPIEKEEVAKDLPSEISTFVQAHVDNAKFNGAILVMKDGKELYKGAHGAGDIVKNELNNTETKFNLASVSKQFTSMVILQLVQEGKLGLQGKLSQYLPWYRKDVADKVTIHHLLSHTSGIPSYTNKEGFMETDVCNAVVPKEFTLSNCSDDLEFEPGADWAYNNSGYYILGALIEEVTGKPYHEVLQEKIFGPLGMNNSGVDYEGNLTNKAIGYTIGEDGGLEVAKCIHMSVPHAAGAIYSTIDDMYLWDRALNTEKLLSKALIDSMYTPVMKSYGYAWGIHEKNGRTTYEHGGGIFGFSTYILRIPGDDLFITVLCNSDGVKSSKVASDIAAIIFGEEYLIPEERNEIKLSAEELEEYTGKFELAPDVIFEFKVNNGGFFGVVTGQNPAELFPYGDDKFFLKVVDAQVQFMRGDDGKVESMILHQNGSHPAKKID